MENQLTKFEISKHLNISRNRLNTLLKQLPPNKNEFDGRYYDEVPPIENIDYKGFHDFAIEYCKYLSSLVSEKGSIKMEEVFDFIESYF